MGIAFSHCKASWSYSGFMYFRTLVADAEGIALKEMAGFATGPGVPWSAVKTKLEPFLHHSDCDGTISVDDLKRVQPALRQIVLAMPQGYDRKMGLLLCDGMRTAITAKEPLEFL